MPTVDRAGSGRSHRELYESMPVMYFEIDAGGHVVAVNAFGAEQLGYAVDELVGRPVLDVFHEEDRADVTEQFEALLAAESGVASWEFRKRHRDGSVLWVREAARAVRTGDGELEVVVVCQDVTDGKRAEEERTEARRVIRRLSLELEEAQEEERRRIAVQLHDDVGQTLALANLKLDLFAEEHGLDDPRIGEIHELIRSALEGTRLSTYELASPVLYELGLVDALKSLCEESGAEEGTEYRLHCPSDQPDLPERIAVHLYRIARELVFNVRKHARASRADIALEVRDGRVRLEVRDDGRGFSPGAPGRPGGIGLFSIGQRVELLGGELRVESAPGGGTRVAIEFGLA